MLRNGMRLRRLLWRMRKPGCEPCPMDEKYDGPYEPWNFDQKCKEEAMRLREEWRKESESAS